VPLDGASAGAPLAVQVADRWHLRHNLAGAVERAVARNRAFLRDDAQGAEPGPPDPTASAPAEGPLVLRTRARYDEVHAALGRGLSLTEISRVLHLDRKTVRRYASAGDPGELAGGARAAPAGLLDPYLPWPRARWEEGCHSTGQLHQEIRARGYRGSPRTPTDHVTKSAPEPPQLGR